jgi:capsular exopolysaccharide synthesis family protein
MNDQSAGFQPNGPLVRVREDALLPASGLRDLVLAGAAAPGKSHVTIGEIWRVISKWWWLIAGIVVACMLVAVAASLMVEPEYRAEVTVEINPEGVQPLQVGELQPVQMQDRDFITTQAGLIRSRSLAERVARSLNLANDPNVIDPAIGGAARSDIAAGIVHGSLQVDPARDSRLVKLIIVHTNPELAARIANAYAEMFIQSNLERRYEANSYARNFLEQRINTIRARLETSERQLVDYAQRQGIVTVNVDSGTGQGGRSEQTLDAQSAVQVNEALQSARTERIAAEQRYRQAQGSGTSTEALANPTLQSLTTQRADLQAQYQEKLGIYREEHPVMVQLRSRIEAIERSIGQQNRSVSSSLRNEFEAARAREAELQTRVDRLRNNLLDLRQRSIQYTILQREVDTNRALYDALLQRYKEVGVAGGVGMNIISIVDRAEVPGAPFTPNVPLNLMIGLVAGLVLGFGSAFALEWMDDTIKNPDDLTGKLQIAPLGVIPKSAKNAEVQDQLVDSRSELSEAYQSVRTALQFATDHGVPRTLLVTSTRPGEGKSTTALSIAHSLASLGHSVLLVDADLRKPTFRGGPAEAAGLSSLLAGSDDVESIIHPTSQNGLFLLPAGRIPPNPAELLAGGRFDPLLDRVSKMFDHVVIDGPPVLGLADAPLLASFAEGTIFVIEAGAIRRAAAVNAVNRLRAVDARLLGGILTKFSAKKYGYGYGYGGDGYAYREGDKPKRQIHLLKSE